MSYLQILILAVLQGAAELLPVSSSAHVIVAEKLMRLDPSTPEAMFLLAMLHTGTMFAVLIYFWSSWRRSYFGSRARFAVTARNVIMATAVTGIIGYVGLVKLVEHTALRHPDGTHGDVEELSNRLGLLALALAAAGLLIVVAGLRRRPALAAAATLPPEGSGELTTGTAALMGLAQAICLPFRGLSRSGTTISAGLLVGAPRRAAEEFSFALAIVLTPAVIGREFLRLRKAHPEALHHGSLSHLLAPSLVGLVLSFLAGLAALRWLSRWLEEGKWHYFGYYCFAAAAFVAFLASRGY